MYLTVFKKGMWLVNPQGERWLVIAEHEAVKKRPYSVTILREADAGLDGFAALASEVGLVEAGYRTEAVDGACRRDGG